jgi:hypothetical protein
VLYRPPAAVQQAWLVGVVALASRWRASRLPLLVHSQRLHVRGTLEIIICAAAAAA